MANLHTFSCTCRCSCGASLEWNAFWEMIGASNDTESFRITDGGRKYDVIPGYADYSDTRFLIIPSPGVGIEVETYTDREHVEYHLSEDCHIDYRDAVTISNALCSYFQS